MRDALREALQPRTRRTGPNDCTVIGGCAGQTRREGAPQELQEGISPARPQRLYSHRRPCWENIRERKAVAPESLCPRPAQRAREPVLSPARTHRHSKCPLLVSDVLLSHGLLRSTIGARGLNYWVRNGTRCTSPAIVADQQGAFGCQRALRCTLKAAQRDVQVFLIRSHRSNNIVKRRARPISTARLNASQRLHLRPINLVVYKGSYQKEISSWDGLPA